MKKAISLLLSLFIICSLFASCGIGTPADETGRLKIVATVFPEYDWIKNILGEQSNNVDLTLLLDNGVDLHSYRPTADDMVKISTCDMFVYVGGESDSWVADALKQAVNKDMVVINLLEALGDKVKAEEIKEGMEADHDHDHGHEETEEADIKDRSLAEFNGEWKSILPFLNSGELDEYVEHEAEEDGEPVDEIKAELAGKWACKATKVSVDGSSISFTFEDGSVETAQYTYAGYSTKTDEDGDITSVRYQFETSSETAPKYVQFNDHAHEPSDEIEHFHIYFGSESFDALNNSESNPFFVSETSAAQDVLDELMEGHREENDEHVWLSLKNAALLCEHICEKLGGLDPANKTVYEQNTASYIEKLTALDSQYKSAVKGATVKTLVFCDRFPFRYLVDDYGLDYFAAFAGCSAESEASFETITFLAGKLKSLGARNVVVLEGGSKKIAETVIKTSGLEGVGIITLNSLPSVTSADVENGADYLSIMTENLENLKTLLK